MGELISLDEYREKRLEAEVEELKDRLQKIIEEHGLYVENLPYFDYNLDQQVDFTYMVCVTPPVFY
jgi:hypothetical protein